MVHSQQGSLVQPVLLPVGPLVPNKHSNYLLNKCSCEKEQGSALRSNLAVFQEYLVKYQYLKKCSITMNASYYWKRPEIQLPDLVCSNSRVTQKELATLGTSRKEKQVGVWPEPQTRLQNLAMSSLSHEASLLAEGHSASPSTSVTLLPT